MRSKYKNLSPVVTAVVLTFAASSSWAASSTVCAPVIGNSGPILNLAVASNFFEPAKELAEQYVDEQLSGAGRIRVCHNSTAHLNGEIRSGTDLADELVPDFGGTSYPYGYDLLFAANRTTPQAIATDFALTSPAAGAEFLYAKGIPVLYGYTADVGNVGGLIDGLGSDTEATISGSGSGNTVAAGAAWVAVADPTLAPYGLAARNILTTGMGYSWPPAFVHTPFFINIDLTKEAVGTGSVPNKINSGFVSKAQICNEPDIAYVQFTNASYILSQGAVVLNAAKTAAVDFADYLNTANPNSVGDLGVTWNDWLTERCYQTIP